MNKEQPTITITIPLTEAEKYATPIEAQVIGPGLRAACDAEITRLQSEEFAATSARREEVLDHD